MTNTEFVLEVLKVTIEFDCTDSLFWKFENNIFKVYAVCNDLFYWATADLEEITEENLPEIRKAFADAIAAYPKFGEIYGLDLFCARMRHIRPQGAAYPKEWRGTSIKALWKLFDDCGPERPMDIFNSLKPSGEK
jgi:hypothetical protein